MFVVWCLVLCVVSSCSLLVVCGLLILWFRYDWCLLFVAECLVCVVCCL